MGYRDRTPQEQLRIDAHILDHFRDNQGNYANEFRQLVRENARLSFDIRYQNDAKPPQIPKEMYNAAYQEVLNDVRDIMAVHVRHLSPLNSENYKLDGQLVRNALSRIGRSMAEDLRVNPVTADPNYNLRDAANRVLEDIQHQTKSNLRLPGNTSEIPAGYFNRTDDLQRGNMMSEYSPSVVAAVQKLRTPLGDRLEAESIRIAVNELASPGVFERIRGNNLNETREAVGQSLRERGVYLQSETRDDVIDRIVDAAVPIARGGKMDDPGGNRGSGR